MIPWSDILATSREAGPQTIEVELEHIPTGKVARYTHHRVDTATSYAYESLVEQVLR